jgi:F-type H+-transporting ATPase subunit epsilon
VETLKLEIITPARLMVREEVDMVEAVGANGEFGILPGHTQFITGIEVGEIRYMKAGKTNHLATGGGYAEVIEDRVTILVDTGEFPEEIDLERAKRTQEEAEMMLRTLPVDTAEYRRYELALLRAIARIGVKSKKL